MDREAVISALEGIAASLRALEVKSLRLFGSTAAGTSHQQSDLDFIVEFDGAATYDRYMEVLELLQRTFDRPVDLVTEGGIKPRIRDRILREAVRVA